MKVAVCGSGQYLKRGLEDIIANGWEVSVCNHPEEAPGNTEVLLCLAYPKILNAKQLAYFHKGCYNFHAGLPFFRGRHPLQWMLIKGVPNIPIAVHRMDEGIDTGPIVVRDWVAMDRNETYASALEKVTAKVGDLMCRTLRQIECGATHSMEQPIGIEPLPRRTPEDSKLSFYWHSDVVHRFVNAMSDPMPNANCDGFVYKRSYIGDRPGDIVARTTDGRYVIATATGVVLVDRE